jgi:hypothetical protein
MTTGQNHKNIARIIQRDLGISYTKALRAFQSSQSLGEWSGRSTFQDEATPPEVLHAVAIRQRHGRDFDFGPQDVAGNTSAAEVTLRWLAAGPARADTDVSWALLKNPSTPRDVLRSLMHTSSHELSFLAQNPNAGDELILEAVGVPEQNNEVEYWASINPGISEATREKIERLMSSDSWRRHVDEETAATLRETYNGWLLLQIHRDCPIGDLARGAQSDSAFPTVARSEQLFDYLRDTAAFPAAVESWDEFVSLNAK